MPSYVAINYDTLSSRAARIENFFGDLGSNLSSLGINPVYHQDIYYDGNGNIRRVLDDEKIQTLSLSDRQNFYSQGLGLMKIAMNKYLLPA
jgi:hypothetical protein